MEFATEYKKFAEAIDSCENEEALNEYQTSRSTSILQKEFWNLRQAFFNSKDPLEKQKIKAKIYRIQDIFGCNIPIRQCIKKFTAPNGLTNIFIAQEASVGKNCVIFQNVYIGTDTFSDSETFGFPIIGNNVSIGAGAAIVGNVLIGDNVRIDPNCCIMKDIPSNCHVVNNGSYAVKQSVPLNNNYLTAQQAMKSRFDKIVFDYAENKDNAALTARKAGLDDLDAIIELYKRRMAWFKWKKIYQWTSFLIHHPKDEFLQFVENGEYYVIEKDSSIIGGFVLSADPQYWTDSSVKAYYIRRVISDVGYKHLGEYIVSKAKELAVADGRQALRVECIFSNDMLNSIWENLGFELKDDIFDDDHFSLREFNFSDKLNTDESKSDII